MVTTKPINLENIYIHNLANFDKNKARNIEVSMLRLDLIHPIISGNKWFKLKYNIEMLFKTNKKGLLSFGGAYSNHLIACACAAAHYGIPSVGIVRGDEHAITSNLVLQQCTNYGMRLIFEKRANYDLKDTKPYIDLLQNQYKDYFIVPEGGNNEWGQKGASEIIQFIPTSFTHILLSVGSGSTFVGIANAMHAHQSIVGFAPMKGGKYLENELSSLLLNLNKETWQITDRFHFGGFGRIHNNVMSFMNQFESQYGIVLDRVYTSKMMLGVNTLLEEGFFNSNTKLLCIHTGGMTGNNL